MITTDISTLYKYVNFPKFWGEIDEKSLDISEIRFQKIIEAFSRLPSKPTKILTIGQVAPIVNYLVHKDGINSIYGVNFIEYFSSAFKEEGYPLKTPKYVVIFNVGYEKAVNLSFSKQILLGLVQTCVDNNSHVIIQSNLELPKLRDSYGIDFQNIVRVPERTDEKIF